MIDHKQLLIDLRGLVRLLEDDLARQGGGADQPLRTEWAHAHDAGRTAATWEGWYGQQAATAAESWVLGTAFLRYIEDNSLIDDQLLLRADRAPSAAETIMSCFDAVTAAVPWVSLFDRNFSPAFRQPISDSAAETLLGFWKSRESDGHPRYTFREPDLNTDLFKDLYGGLSETTRKAYALLPTPDFVADFIIGLTLDAEANDSVIRVLDPACGSGTFLTSAAERIMRVAQQRHPEQSRRENARRALGALAGVDLYPNAAAITRFRLLMTALRLHGVSSLGDLAKADVPFTVAIGDSLLEDDNSAPGRVFRFSTEDIGQHPALLSSETYDAVAVNPPYITVGDPALRESYRQRFASVTGSYALTIPFIQRSFELAKRGTKEHHGGHVGILTANTFMRREFGRTLATEYLVDQVRVTHVIDTSGAFITGHGTPTVILAGVNEAPDSTETVSTVVSIRGEPDVPQDPANGMVWRSIQANYGQESADEWTESSQIQRSRLRSFPWTLGGTSTTLFDRLSGHRRLRDFTERIGYFGRSGADDAFTAPPRVFQRLGAEREAIVSIITGSEVRDWAVREEYYSFFPPDVGETAGEISRFPVHDRRLWPYRSWLDQRVMIGGTVAQSSKHRWFDWYHVFGDGRLDHPRIVFSWVSSHNNFSRLPAGIAPLHSAPIIEFHADPSVLKFDVADRRLTDFLAILNSSVACFWLKQVSHSKGQPAAHQHSRTEAWDTVYEFTGHNVAELPIPEPLPDRLGEELASLAENLVSHEPSAVCAAATPTRERLDAAQAEYRRIRGCMVALQEELDWDVYRRYGLISEDDAVQLVAEPEIVPEVNLGGRAFEIVLARSGVETQWFVRHGSTPITEIPGHWPEAYKRVVAARIRVIEERTRDIGLIERPECKRRWYDDPWEKKEAAALKTWLLDRCEDRALWFDDAGDPRPLTVNRLAHLLRTDDDVVSVARLYAGNDADLAHVLADIVADEHVPYLAAYRYKEPGLRKRAQWEATWEKQREEDRTGTGLDIPVPPKYTSADFTKNSYWRNRGKLDVPKERFISYPGASPDGDRSLMLAWAGLDHAQQAHVLTTLIDARATGDPDKDKDRLTPLVAGLKEVMPWVRQWHGERDELGSSTADDYNAILEEQKAAHGLSNTDLDAWRPPKSRRGRPPKRPSYDLPPST